MKLSASKPRDLLLLAAVLGLLGWAVIACAWVSDDAYITFRTVDNSLHGFGLRWNVDERVQTFTHPLWLFLLIPATAVAGDPYWASLILSFLLTLGAAGIVIRYVAEDAAGAGLGILLLAVSKSFVDYSTSGLENALSHFLLAAFAASWVSTAGPRRQWLLGLTAGLAVLNRMDLILLLLPALAVEWGKNRSWRTVGRLAAGFIPFLGWELFALFYYGFPFPNTAYAKLQNGLSAAASIRLGLTYLAVSARLDPITPAAILAAFSLNLRRSARPLLPLALGLPLYLLYLLKIGGDFMGGRFLSAPLFLAACLLARFASGRGLRRVLPVAAGLLLVGLVLPRSPLRSGPAYARDWPIEKIFFRNNITDERAYFYASTGMLGPREQNIWEAQGRWLRDRDIRLVHQWAIGYTGYFGGPRVHIIDGMALADPLLSRLPPFPEGDVVPGHFWRIPPIGYWDTLREGRNVIASPELAAYYDRLRLVTSAPLLAPGRLAEILRFNLGGNDDLVRSYLQSPLARTVEMVVMEDRPGPGLDAPGMVPGSWVTRVRLSRIIHPRFLELTLFPADTRFLIVFKLAGRDVAAQGIFSSPSGDENRSFWPIAAVAAGGADEILVYPVSGAPEYSFSFSPVMMFE